MVGGEVVSVPFHFQAGFCIFLFLFFSPFSFRFPVIQAKNGDNTVYWQVAVWRPRESCRAVPLTPLPAG